ncbi:MAG: hypothetical protein Q8902_02665, partial [Bacteroidota bacterium]|nr:hypothetical protein [Bacteroidota bacterium]
TIAGGLTVNGGLTLGTALAVAQGGTGQTSYTDGQLLIGNSTGNTLTKATLTGTTNEISVANGSGSITLSTPQAIATTSTPQFAKLGLGAAAGTEVLEVTGNIKTLSSGTITAAGNLSAASTFTVAVVTATVASNATTLDNTHTFFIIPTNGQTVAVTAPATATGKIIYVENSSGFITSGIAAVPNNSTWQLIYDGAQWVHAN